MAEKVVVQLVLDTSKYTSNAQGAARSTAKIQGAADKTAGSMGKLQQTAGKLGLALGAAFAAKAALDFAKSAISAFSNLDESINAVAVSFGDAAEGVFELGENSAEQFGLSTRAVNEAAVAMSAFASKIDAADPADAFENVLQRATDFASVMNIDVEESLLLFRSGLAGESEPLRKFGIDVSAATVSLVGLEAGLGGANGKLDEGEKVQARYLAIMEQTEKTAGDFANTADGLANSQRILSAKWEEAQATLGEELAPVMVELLGIAVSLIPIFAEVVNVIGSLVTIVLPLVKILGLATEALADYNELVAEASSTETLGEDVGLLAFNFRGLATAMTGIPIQMGAAAIAAEAADDKFEGLAQRQKDLLVPTDRFGIAIETVTANQLAGTDATGKYNDFISATATRAAEAATELEREAAGVRSVLAAQAEAASPALRLLRTQQKLVASREKLAELRAATGEEKASVEELTDAELDLVGAQIDVDSAAANLAGRVDESAAAFIRTAVQAGLLAEDARELAKQLGLIPTTIDVNLRLNLGGLTTGEAANLLAGSSSRRHGGPVSAGEPFIVGEAGPELFIPDQAGRIIPNGGSVGGQSIVVNVNDSVTTDLAADLSAGLIAAQITQQVEMLRV